MPISLEISPRTYPSQGRCIFCLKTPDELTPEALTDEHIIPFAISGIGEVKIRGGTCGSCNREANERYEKSAMATDLKTPRILLDLKRRKKKKPLVIPPVALGNALENGEPDFSVELSAEEYPNLISLTMFEVAGKLAGINRGGNLTSIRLMTFYIGPKPKQVMNITLREMRNHTAFSLTLAKIAYTYAVARIGVDHFDGDEIRALLRGCRTDTYNFVGGLSIPQEFSRRHLHGLYIKDRGEILSVVVHLFASCKMQPYEIVVGKRK